MPSIGTITPVHIHLHAYLMICSPLSLSLFSPLLLVWIRVIEAKNLPVMNPRTKSTDAYVEISFAGKEDRTEIVYSSINPAFNANFRYEIVDDGQLQDEPVHFKVMDKVRSIDRTAENAPFL
jgi:hypothetical protein